MLNFYGWHRNNKMFSIHNAYIGVNFIELFEKYKESINIRR